MFVAYPQWDNMKLSLMIEEANKISAKLRKQTVFSRYNYSGKNSPVSWEDHIYKALFQSLAMTGKYFVNLSISEY